MMKNFHLAGLITAFLIAFFLRLYQLDAIPPSLNWDEVSLGYNAYSILKTGKDEWGELFPLTFRAYGDYKLPGYVYAAVPFIAIFGLNEWGVRLPSVLAGFGIVILVFFIIRRLTGNSLLALVGTFFAACSPWLILLSRIALEANLALFFLTLSVYLFLKSFQRQKLFVLSSLFFGLSLFTYNSVRVVGIPLLILAIAVFRKNFNLKSKFSLIGFLVAFIFISAAFPIAFLSDSSARYRWTTILDEGAIAKINELRGSSALPPLVEKIAFNKVTYFIPESIKNYFSHFNPNFLFFNGGSHFQYSVPGSGLILPVLFPLIILGLLQISRQRLSWQYFILGWLLIAPLPAAITRDAPHALRALFLSIPLLILSVLGFEYFVKNLSFRLSIVAIFIIFSAALWQSYSFWLNYSGSYKINYSWSWQYGYKNVADFIKDRGGDYERIYITKKNGEPHMFLLFYLKYEPAKYQTNPSLVRYQKSDWYWVDGLDSYQFVNDWEVKEIAGRQSVRELLITSPGNYPEGSRVIKTINFLDGRAVFDIVEL